MLRRVLREQRRLHLSQPPLQDPQRRWNLRFVLPSEHPQQRIVRPNQQARQHTSLLRCLLPREARSPPSRPKEQLILLNL